MKWRIINHAALRVRCWGDETVVYNILSGDTHLLQAPAAALLEALQCGPSELEVLTGVLAQSCRCEVDDALVSTTEQLLSDMRALALVESA